MGRENKRPTTVLLCNMESKLEVKFEEDQETNPEKKR